MQLSNIVEKVDRADCNRMKQGGDSVHFEGWLLKEDPTTKVYRRRFFVLHNKHLFYFQLNQLSVFDLLLSSRSISGFREEATLL